MNEVNVQAAGILGSIISGVLGGGSLAALGCLWKATKKRFKIQKDENDANKEGTKALLRDRLIQSYRHFSIAGEVPIYERDNFMSLYKAYHALGGNGVIEDMKNKFLKFEIESKN